MATTVYKDFIYTLGGNNGVDNVGDVEVRV